MNSAYGTYAVFPRSRSSERWIRYLSTSISSEQSIDTTNIFTMIPNLQIYKAEITTQVRTALKDPDSADNPVTTYYPKLKVEF